MGKIIIYYKYINIERPSEIMAWQKDICQKLDLKGRILIAEEGINATVGGDDIAINEYKKLVYAHPLFKDVDIKESEGSKDHFPKLQIKIKKEIVNLGIDPKKLTPQNSGKHLLPFEVHELIKSGSKNLVLLDTRNNYESKIGTFKDAITPDINNFRDLPEYIDKNLDLFKNKEVLMFCTAGVRCERATAYLKEKNIASEVYQINGGIQRYAEQYPDGFFRGKNYVFDGRISVKINDDILASCIVCQIPYDDYTNCINAECNKQIIVCYDCAKKYHNTCGQNCLDLVTEKKVNIRSLPAKIEKLNVN